MKQIKRRASAALLLAILMIAGTVTLFMRLLLHGDEWAAYSANNSVYNRGVLSCGTLTDRNGVVLAHADENGYGYAEDGTLRVSSLHAVGDYRGFMTSTALRAYAKKLTGYSTVYGTTRTGEGNTVALSLDAALQNAAWRNLGYRKGAVLVMNYETSEILCMVSSPSYDPTGDPDQSVEGLFLNRCLNGLYTPGSVFKLVTLCAAIENIDDLYDRSFYCQGSVDVAGVEIKCVSAHGTQTIEQALANSCNCAFARLSLELGGDTLKSYADKMGFTRRLSMDGIATSAGSFEAVQERSSYLAWSGIGQYTDMICPYAMLRYVSAIAAGGTVKEPTMLLGGSNGTTRLLKAETAEAIGEMMSFTGTTHYQNVFPGLDVCAKTGTAELGDGDTHAWMVGYLKSGPPLSFVVVLERGGSGYSQAGSVANAVLQKAKELYSDD